MEQTYGGEICRIKFLHAGFRDLLYHMRKPVNDVTWAIRADAIASAGLTDKDFIADVYDAEWPTSYKYPGRVLGIVWASTLEAKKAQAETKVLSIAAAKPRRI